MLTSTRPLTKREEVQENHPAPEQACQLSDYASKVAKEGKLDAALTAIRRALALAPDHPILLSHLGAFLWDVGQYDEAEAALQKSVSIEPNYAPALGNLGSVLGAKQKFDAAISTYKRALEIEPDFVDAQWNCAMMLLDAGRWSEAWPYYESRKERGNKQMYPTLPYPMWKGENLNGKTLWVQSEQGVGDRTLFARYLHWVKKEFPDCRILYQMNATDLPDMSNFMWGFRKIVEFVPNGVPWAEDVDYGTYLMSLPGLHGTTPTHIPAEPGFILEQALRHKKSVNLPKPNMRSLRVGIVWSGSPIMKRNLERSVPFEVMLRFMENPNITLYSLQFDNSDLYDFGAAGLIPDLAREIRPLGFSGTAAALLNFDLVITACTATAHIAGVLGVPTWVLLCANPYWVWLRGRADSVWYPSAKLFRQRSMYDWGPVFEDVREELAKLAKRNEMKE